MTSQGGPPESDSEARDFRSPLDAEAPFTSALGEYQRTEAERQQLAAIIEGARDAIWSWTPDGIITRWNAEAERLFGYASEEMIGKSLLTLVPPDREEVARDVIARLRRGSWYGQYETVRLHKSGSLVAVELTVSPLRDPSGNIIGAATVCRDITERKHFQESLARRVKELAALYQLTDRLQHADSIGASCDAALDAIFDALDCPRASILLFDEASVMRFVAWRGLSEGYRRAVDGHSPWTADTSNPEPIFVSDIGAAAEPEALKQTIRTEGIAALALSLCLPTAG